ncbi:hypothetical protein RRG08_062207 [Elysia crispata]|uniref:Uncharacterized protein n=1 Tax=Elysia crispata TaxID=231223 RepID=A0AAE0Y975_9GAST|nr:hypothetical protein RRG08_062207 [Elysia crispata]
MRGSDIHDIHQTPPGNQEPVRETRKTLITRQPRICSQEPVRETRKMLTTRQPRTCARDSQDVNHQAAKDLCVRLGRR